MAAIPAPSSAPAGDPDWVPNEYRGNEQKWKDPIVYVDGKPVGALWFGELPRAVEILPVGHMEEADGRTFYEIHTYEIRIADYLRAVGVPLGQIREVHFYGGGEHVAVVSGRELRRLKDRFTIGYGDDRGGKIKWTPPDDLQTNTSFDLVTGVAVYVKKRPPQVKDDAVILDGDYTDLVPYYGEPLRGGVRVYIDDKLATTIKRRLLTDKDELAKMAGNELRWDLRAFLQHEKVPVKKLAAVEVIYDERREQRFGPEALEKLYFVANPQKKGEVLLGDERIPAEAIALYTRPLPKQPLKLR